MPKQHLSSQFIRNLKPQGKRVEYYDQHLIENNTLKAKGVKGLFIRLTKAGSVYFYYRYWFKQKPKSYKIGSYPDIGLSEARDKARELAAQVNEGTDPQAEKNKRKHTPKEATFKAVANEFINKYLPTLRKRTADEYKRHLKVYLTSLNNVPINEISKNQLLSILDKKAITEGSPTQANRIRATLSILFSFAGERDLVGGNLIASVPTYKTGNTKRSRYYSPEEIQELWQWFDSFITPTGQVFKMLLITGQRKTETMQMKWKNIRGDVWTIPAELAKNKQPHDVPLSDMALQIIEQMRPITGESDYIFCSPRKENHPIGSIKNSKEKIQDESDITDFRPHDLRRTVATFMAKLAVDRTVLGKILNHKGLAGDSQVTAIYDRHSYMKEKRQAMNRWSHKLQQIIEGAEAKIHKIG
jgi:integrase